MKQWKRFRGAYGKGKQYRPFQSEDREDLRTYIPDWLLDLWEEDGWASYRDGVLWSVDPRQFAPLVDLWRPPRRVAFPVARTAFGSVLLLTPSEEVPEDSPGDEETENESNLFLVAKIDPHTGAFSIVGADDHLFLTGYIARPEYIKDVFWEPRVQRAIKDVGPLAWDEMYAFEPALALGGSGEPETVRRVKLFDHHLLLSQLVELKFVKY